MIEMVKRTHWEDFLQSVDDKMVWTAHQYASGSPSDGGKAQVPTLNLEKQLEAQPLKLHQMKKRPMQS